MNALHPLGQLIQSVEDSRGWTLREISRRIDRAGYSMTHSHVGNLKKKPIRSITRDMVRALAVGLDVPERVVALAAIESMGVHDVNPAEAGAAIAIARDPSLSERDRRVLLAVVREMQSEDDQDAPATEPTTASDISVPVEGDAQPDGVTVAAGAGAPDTNPGGAGAGEFAHHRRGGSANEPHPTAENSSPGAADRPWLHDEFALAAKRGVNRGKEARRQQDREAEGGGA